MANDSELQDKREFESVMRALQGDIAYFSAQMTLDSTMRLKYSTLIAKMSAEMKVRVASGSMTWKQAATEAQQARNIIMENIRRKTTPVAKAMAQRQKLLGKTLQELIARNTQKLYGNVNFETLTIHQQNYVYKAIVESSGSPSSKVSAKLAKFSRAGRALIIFSLAISTYYIIAAEDKTSAIKREVAITSSGVAGGIAGGATASLVCGPGAS